MTPPSEYFVLILGNMEELVDKWEGGCWIYSVQDEVVIYELSSLLTKYLPTTWGRCPELEQGCKCQSERLTAGLALTQRPGQHCPSTPLLPGLFKTTFSFQQLPKHFTIAARQDGRSYPKLLRALPP